MNTEREQEQITVSGIHVDVVKKDIKNMHLAVYPPSGRVQISTPKEMRLESIRLYVISKLSWIKKHIKGFREQNRQPEREYIQGESHYFQGQRYLLNVVERDAAPEVALRNKKYIDLKIRPGSSREKRREVMREWYREELKKDIPPLVEWWEQKMDLELSDWRVRRMKTKWGSCNTEAKRILLNLELAKKSPECLEYVVVHEMVHLQERLHSEQFKALMDRYMPSWRERRDKLNELVY